MRRATHVFSVVLIISATVAGPAPIAQAAAPAHDSGRAFAAAWQAYRGLPGGPPQTEAPNTEQAYVAAWPSYFGRPGGPPTASPRAAEAYAAAWPSYRDLPGGPSVIPATPTGSSGFDWGDAGVGAGAALGIVLLACGLLVVITTARSRREARHA
jgi:hypothetical protein